METEPQKELLAFPEEPVPSPQPEQPGVPVARWIPLAEVPHLPIWPKQVKELCRQLSEGQAPQGCPSFIGHIGSPWIQAESGLDF